MKGGLLGSANLKIMRHRENLEIWDFPETKHSMNKITLIRVFSVSIVKAFQSL